MAQVSTHIHQEQRLALIEVRGETHGSDIVKAAQALGVNPRWNRKFDTIWDCRLVGPLILEPDDLVKMAEAKVEVCDGAEIIVAHRELDREMAKVCALMLRVRNREAKVVSTLEDAFAELDVEKVSGS